MLKYVFAKIKRLFQKNRKQNSIQVGTVENGNIYQDSIVKIENPAIAINHVKDNPEDLKELQELEKLEKMDEKNNK